MASLLKDYLLERIQIDLKTGCWNWKQSCSGHRYGAAWFEGKKFSAHRASYEVFIGSIPSGLNACHKCDNTKCINPYHIFLGTQKENNADCRLKGRNGGTFKKGHRVNVKLSVESILKIKDLLSKKVKQKIIASNFGITQGHVSHIKVQKTWKNIGV